MCNIVNTAEEEDKSLNKSVYQSIVKVFQAKEAYAVVQTGETALYGNVILQKGVIPGPN